MNTLLLILVILFLIGAIPLHGINPHYGYGVGGLGVIILIVLLVLLLR